MRALYTAATGMTGAQIQIENIANNLANASSTGFKKSRETFADLVYQKVGSGKEPMQVGSGTRVAGLARDFAQGDTIPTSSPYDLLIDGPGFFKLTTPSDETRYTRDGHFRVDGEGKVVSSDGSILQPEVVLEPGDELRVDSAGNIFIGRMDDSGTLSEINAGQLTLVTFPNPAGLQAMGGNTFVQTTASGEAREAPPGQEGAGEVLQSYLEGSNVDAAEELISMITAQRGYELSSKVIQTADEMMQTAAQLRR